MSCEGGATVDSELKLQACNPEPCVCQLGTDAERILSGLDDFVHGGEYETARPGRVFFDGVAALAARLGFKSTEGISSGHTGNTEARSTLPINGRRGACALELRLRRSGRLASGLPHTGAVINFEGSLKVFFLRFCSRALEAPSATTLLLGSATVLLVASAIEATLSAGRADSWSRPMM